MPRCWRPCCALVATLTSPLACSASLGRKGWQPSGRSSKRRIGFKHIPSASQPGPRVVDPSSALLSLRIPMDPPLSERPRNLQKSPRRQIRNQRARAVQALNA
eukprot:13268778-Alexandrium_andersonii.AAC.1